MPEIPSESGHETESLTEHRQRIRQLNDNLRRTFMGGQILMTPGFSDLPNLTKAKALAAIRSFDNFNEDNDPWGTHEFGGVEIDDYTVWFKIDAYDHSLEYGSPDASDPNVTTRVMTLMTPQEY